MGVKPGWAAIKLAAVLRDTLDKRCYFEIELRMWSFSI